MPYTRQTQNDQLTIRLLQRRLRLAEEGWECDRGSLLQLVAEIKSVDFTQVGAAADFQNTIMEVFPAVEPLHDSGDSETDYGTDLGSDSGSDSDRETDRETDRESGRETDRETDRESGSESDSESGSDGEYNSMPELEGWDQTTFEPTTFEPVQISGMFDNLIY